MLRVEHEAVVLIELGEAEARLRGRRRGGGFVRAADAGRRRLGILFVPGRRIASEGAHLADRYR